MTNINPSILQWARVTAGYSLDDACRKLQLRDTKDISAIEKLSAMESGEIQPTRNLLLKMAKQYHRPLVVFYMSAPPKKGNRGQDFRTLPKDTTTEINALVDSLIRNIQARQRIIRSALEDDEDVKKLSFVKSMQIDAGIDSFVSDIKRTIKFDLTEFRKKPNPQGAFNYLRSCVESIGVYVLLIGDLGSHHTNISLEMFRGFSIADDIVPFIVINDSDTKSALSFTLIHELVHIWLGQTGISNQFFDKSIEKFCNDVASEILVPSMDFFVLKINIDMGFEDILLKITDYAKDKNVSNSMVAYKLFRMGRINKVTWKQLNNKYYEFWLANKNQNAKTHKSGPNYYLVRRYQIGMNLISTVQRMILEGTLSTTKAGKVLGVKAKNIQKLMEINKLSKTNQIS